MADALCCPEPHTGLSHASVPASQQSQATDEYLPRDPADSVLCRTVRKHLPRFLDAAAVDGAWALPTFVTDALQSLAYCGDFTRGFAHFECDRCRTPRIVPFSCQSRLCPTCAGRRMNEFAAYATDRLMPHTDYRQWTISFPWELRRALAFDPEFARAVYRISGEVILDWIHGAAADEGVFGSPAGVLHIQRFGDALTCNPHAHFVMSDAVFCDAPPSMVPLPPGASPPSETARSFRTRAPTQADVQAVADRIEARLARLLERRAAAAARAEPSADATDRERLGQLADAKPVTDHTTPGPALRPAAQGRAKKPLAARSACGVDVHAGVSVPAYARDQLLRLREPAGAGNSAALRLASLAPISRAGARRVAISRARPSRSRASESFRTATLPST